MPETIKFDHYEVLTREDGAPFELGRGAMGITYKAIDTALRFPVALKVINAAYVHSEVARQRFIREAQSAAKLRHRNVASVFHLRMDGDTYFYAMEFIDGETVESLVKHSGPQPALTALRIALQVARALHAAEMQGIVHRDIKPANLMVVREDDELCVKVIDFGLVKIQDRGDDASATLSVAGFFGTPHFASPEQLRELEIDVRSDIYSLGVTLWYILAGQTPFGGSMMQVMSQQIDAPPPFDKLTGLAPEIENLLRRMLEKDAALRPQTAAALRQEIEQCIEKLAGGPLAAAARAALEEQALGSALSGSVSGQPSFQPGTMVAGRYEILRPLSESKIEAQFQARDESRCDIRLILLRKEIAANPEFFTRLQGEVEQLRAVEHVNLLRVESLEALDDEGLLLLEWTNGFSLLEALRARRELGAPEAVPLLEQLAAGIDYALSAGVQRIAVGLPQAMVHFPGGMDARRDLLRSAVTDWPPYIVKLNPLDLAREAALSETWAGAQTLAGGAASAAAAPAQGAPRGICVRALATIACELLGGTPPPAPPAGAPFRYTPLPALTEGGNAVLKRAFESPESFRSVSEFVSFLRDLQGLAATPPPVTPPATTPPRLAPAARTTVPPPLSQAAPAPAAKKSSPAILVGSIAAVLIAGAGIYLIFGRSKPDAIPAPTPAPLVIATPEPKPVVVTPKSTPNPGLSREDQLKQAMAKAEAIDAKGDLADAIAAWVDVVKNFPEAGAARTYLGKHPYALRERNQRLTEDEFASLRQPLTDAADLGVVSAMVVLGDYYDKKAPVAAFRWFSAAADKEDRAALTKVGLMLASGDGAERNIEKAVTYFEKAADKGDPEAQFALAECLTEGKGTQKNEARAVELLKTASQNGNLHAINRLGDYYFKGKFVKQDVLEARRLFTQAAQLGDAQAFGNLGVLYMMGQAGIPRDPTKGISYFQQGADQGSPSCMFLLAQALEAGDGADANPAEAERWYKKAAQAGHPRAKEWCAQHRVAFTGQ